MKLEEDIKNITSWFLILVAASYSFTLGYLETLKIPITPYPIEAFYFYFRAWLSGEHCFKGFFYTFVPLFVLLIFSKAQICCRRKFNKNRCLVDIGLISLLTILAWWWCNYSFHLGTQNPKKSSLPKAYQTHHDNDQLLLAWISGDKIFWIDCNNSSTKKLIGVKDGKEFFVRDLGYGDDAKRICGD